VLSVSQSLHLQTTQSCPKTIKQQITSICIVYFLSTRLINSGGRIFVFFENLCSENINLMKILTTGHTVLYRKLSMAQSKLVTPYMCKHGKDIHKIHAGWGKHVFVDVHALFGACNNV